MPVINEEDAHACDVHEFIDLGQARPVSSFGEPVLTRLADAVRLIQNQRVELVRRQGPTLIHVEVAELRRSSRPNDLAHVLRKCLRPGEVHRVESLSRQPSQQVQSDNRFPRTRTTMNQHHGLFQVGCLRALTDLR